MHILENVVSDRGSKYAVSGGAIATPEDAARFLAELKRIKKFARATHNTWAVVLETGGQREALKNDDGEAGAAAVILKMLEREGLVNHIIVVTRWYGGVKLGGDRFRHVVEAVRVYLAERR